MNQHKMSVPFRYLLLLIILFAGLQVAAQETTITIKVTSTKKDPVSFASITLISFPDSSFRQTKTADSSGLARFNTVGYGQYSVRISAVNYQTLEKGITTLANKTVFNFSMDPVAKTLETAVVRSQKPLMRQEDDKTIVDPENLVATSTSGYEVIEKTPGLFVD
ncbi:MAG TPA: carboxypeptidase-like regulatory domain-containing protein, partial [Chitinophagaceae bacterium]|nr:carboxypeptidase-like regulatory domain-containing protein [Chitinophagaceae bacterium]